MYMYTSVYNHIYDNVQTLKVHIYKHINSKKLVKNFNALTLSPNCKLYPIKIVSN